MSERIKPAEAGARVDVQCLAAAEKKLQVAFRLTKTLPVAISIGDLETALEEARLLYTAIIHASNARALAERFAGARMPRKKARNGGPKHLSSNHQTTERTGKTR